MAPCNNGEVNMGQQGDSFLKIEKLKIQILLLSYLCIFLQKKRGKSVRLTFDSAWDRKNAWLFSCSPKNVTPTFDPIVFLMAT